MGTGFFSIMSYYQGDSKPSKYIWKSHVTEYYMLWICSIIWRYYIVI
jgi:hypothetical protein